MSDFVEKITLDLDGTAVDGSAANGLRKTGEGVSGLLGDLNKLQESTGAEATLGKVGAAVNNLGASLLKMAGAVVGFEALKALAGDMLGAVKENENLTLSIAATMAATNGWSASMGIATGVLVKLQETAALVGGTNVQMVDTFAMLKRNFGGTSDQAVTLTQNLALLARQTNTTADALSERLVFIANSGKMMMGAWRGTAGIALKPLIDPMELQMMQQAGQAIEYLNAKITGNSELVDQLKNTWSYLTAELAKSKHEAMETIGSGFEPLKASVRDLIAEIGSAESQAAFGRFGFQIAKAIEDTKKFFSVIDGKGIVASLLDGLLDPIIKGYRQVVAFLTGILGEIVAIAGAIFAAISFGPDYFARLKESLGKIDTVYADWLKKFKDIREGVGMVSSPGAAVSEKPGAAALPGADAAAAVKDNSAEIAATIKNLWDQVVAYAQTGLARELALEEATTAKEIAAFVDKATTEKQVIDGTLAYKALAAVKEQALNFASQAQNEAEIEKQRKQAMDQADWYLAEQTKLYDELAGVTDDYYVKQQAQIDKQINREKDLLLKRRDDGKLTQEQYAALIAQLGKLSEAERVHLELEKNSIIGFRKTMEEQAALLVKTTDSVAGGILAGVKTIAASVKSTTEITRDYVVGVWGVVTTGLDGVLQKLEGGTATWKDLFKSMTDSALKSFNTMIEEMVKKWLFGKDQMAAGGGLESLFGGAARTQLAGTTSDPYALNNAATYQATGNIGTQPKGATAAGVVGAGATGLGIGTAVGGMSGAPGFSTGAAIGGVVGGIAGAALGATVLSALGPTILGLTATGYGIIIAAVLAIIGGLISVLAQPNTEMHIFGRDFAPQIKMAAQNVQSTMVDIFAASMLPDAAGFAKSLNDRVRMYLANAQNFEVHAGEQADIEADLKTLLSGIIPTELLHTLIGQQRTGGQDVAGISGASKYGGMLAPDAPINKMLTDLGLTADKVQELAGQIDTMAPEDWMKMLSGLVGLVAAAGTLGKQLSMTYAETIASADADAAKSPAGKLADRLAGVTDLLKAVSFYTGTEQITKGQEAIAAAQQFYNDAKTAMLQLSAMAKQVTQDVADETKKVRDALKTPGELFAQSFSDLQHDYDRMRFAANPEDMAAAWASAKADFEAVAGELVNRIKQIRSVLDDIHTLQAAMLTGPGPNAQTDPQGWLAQNTIAMEKYRVAMTAATPGSPEQIAAATSFAGLIRDRYQMELDLLARVKSTIESINQSIDEQLFNIKLGEATGNDKTQLLYNKMNDLYGQLQVAKTPEEVQRLTSQIQGLAGTLLSSYGPNDPNRGAAVEYITGILELVRKAALGNLGDQGTVAQIDISTLGPKLAAAETIMADALEKVQTDLDALVWHFGRAGEFMTGKLNDWGVEIAGQLNALGPQLTAMVTNFTDVNTALSGGSTGTGGPGKGPKVPIADNLAGLGSGVDDARGALVDFTATVTAATAALGGKAA